MTLMKRPKPKAVLFDLDGTLLDTAADLHHALNLVLQDHQRQPVALEQARPVASHGSTGLLKLGFGSDFNANNRLTLREAFLSAYAQDPFSRTTYFDGIEAMLTLLQEQGIEFGIVTNKPTQFTQALLPHFTLLKSCRAIVCGDTLSVAKPDPAPVQHAAELLGVAPEHCWYVGDAERDIQAGKAAGMFTVLASYGYISDEDEFHLWQADSAIEHALELVELWNSD